MIYNLEIVYVWVDCIELMVYVQIAIKDLLLIKLFKNVFPYVDRMKFMIII